MNNQTTDADQVKNWQRIPSWYEKNSTLTVWSK